ncbi:MAG: hypothetical protein ACI3VX_03680 [Faecousia sp.]
MWAIISNISSIVTCIAFLLYLAGHIWTVVKSKDNIYEKFSVVPCDSNTDIENEDNVLLVDSVGCEFFIESNYGINNVKIYKIDSNFEDDGTTKIISKHFVKTFKDLKTDKLFIRCDLGEVVQTTQIEIERSDYTVITFDLYESGENGQVVIGNYKYKLTVRGFLYHLCV